MSVSARHASLNIHIVNTSAAIPHQPCRRLQYGRPATRAASPAAACRLHHVFLVPFHVNAHHVIIGCSTMAKSDHRDLHLPQFV
jgi:hypothetical protein